MSVSIPTIHSNGTSEKELSLALEVASSALRKALRAMRDVTPNGRDYYTQGDGALTKAIDAHADRCRRLDDVQRELVEIYTGIYDR